jgi:hypothetical protein
MIFLFPCIPGRDFANTLEFNFWGFGVKVNKNAVPFAGTAFFYI